MKKIVPFNRVLKFNKNISEINSISLEHSFTDMGDELSGRFNILGEYTINDESLQKEEFNFDLPFDIALGINYNKDNMVVDIDDFRYEIISDNEIRVDIDLYIDGEVLPISSEKIDLDENDRDIKIPLVENDIDENPTIDIDINNDNDNVNINNNENIGMNIFGNISNDVDYATYRIYTVMENDTIETIMQKYNVSLEDIKKYNDISNLKPLDKLIIPSDEK